MKNLGLVEKRLICYLSIEDVANACGVKPGTVKLWESGKLRTPKHVEKVIQYSGGFLPHEGWEGWRFWNGELWAPEGYRYAPGDIRAIYWLRRENQSLRQELEKHRPPREPEQLRLPLPHIPAWERYKHLKRG